MFTIDNIRISALQVGLDACSVASATYYDQDAQYMNRWVAQGQHGNMEYLEHNCDKRYDIRLLVPGAVSVVVCLLRYENCGHDYHRTMKSKLYELEHVLMEQSQHTLQVANTQHIFCDSAPVLERRIAQDAGLGFIGRNHQFIHPVLGSRVHIGELVLNEDVIGRDQPVVNSCGQCTQCIEACPNHALGNEEWDATKCVAYITHKCEICQINCPYNESRFSK